jgi:glycosyltransferase involved in cell wall biosynthesis
MSYNTVVTISTSRPTIGLIATLLSTAPTYRGAGIHQYSANLLAHLPRQAPHFDYRAFVMDRAYAPPAGVSVQRPARLPANPPGRILWEQTRVAWESRRLHLLHGFAFALPLTATIPSVVTVHDLTFILFADAFPKSKQRYLSHITARSCNQAQAVIVISQATARDLQRLLHTPAEKIHVIYPGVDERYQPLPTKQVEAYRHQKGWPQRFLLMVGTLEPRKNHLGLIESYARYRRMARKPLPLLIGGGKGWHFQQIFQRVQALGLEDDIHFLGYVPWEDLPWLYNAATLFIYPSHYEGFGLPVAEAMRCGTPVITSNVSSQPEVAGDAALTIDPDNPTALAEAMLHVLEESPDSLQVMRARGIEQAARFTWEQMAAQTAEVYARVLNHTHG